MPDITETRWCSHGKRFDDYCEQCEIEDDRIDNHFCISLAPNGPCILCGKDSPPILGSKSDDD